MAKYIVSYDLHAPGQKYDCLSKKLKGYGTYWHMQESVWIISTASSAVQVRDNLQGCLDSNDKLFVGKLSGEAAWTGRTEANGKWLKGVLEAVHH